jgi:hypothetical protein
MRATHTLTLMASFALCTTLFAGCESSENTNTGPTQADAQSETDGGIVTADGAVQGDATLPDGGEPDTPQPDASAPDAGPPEPDRSISPLAKVSACKQICEDAIEECADEVPFSDVETCREMCEADLADDPAHLTNWVCAQYTCGADLCGFGDNGIETKLDPHPACIELCGLADGCGGIPELDIPPGEVGLCIGSCTGTFLADAFLDTKPDAPSFGEVVECITAALNDECDMDAISPCVGGEQQPGATGVTDICTYACSAIIGDPNDPELPGCDAGSPAKQEMPDFLKCMEGCTMTDDPGQAMATLACLAVSDCGKALGTVSYCIDYPIEVLPSCEPACETVDDLCTQEVPGGLYCPEFCTGGTMNIENLASTEDVAACMDAVDTCEDDGFGAMLMCHVEPPEHCEATCGALDACDLDDDGGCMDSCAVGYLGQSVEDLFPACVAQADGDCGTMSECAALVIPPGQDP